MIKFANLQLCPKINGKYAPDENFCGHFCPRRKAANFCHPASVGMNQPRAVLSARNMLFFTISAVLIGFFLCSECKKLTNELPVRFDRLCLITRKSFVQDPSNINVFILSPPQQVDSKLSMVDPSPSSLDCMLGIRLERFWYVCPPRVI